MVNVLNTKYLISLLIIIVLIGVILFLIFGLGFFSQEQQPDIVQIGVLVPLSGGFADLGGKIQKGAELAAEEINSAGGVNGKKISLVTEDEQCDPKAGLNALEKMTSVDNLKLIVGPLCSGVVLSVAPYAQSHQVILMQASQVPVVPFAGQYVFRPISGAQIMGPREAEYAIFDLNIRTVAILAVNSDLGKGYSQSFRSAFENLGGQIVDSEQFNSNDTDFRSQINKISQIQSDAILIIGSPNEMGLAAKQIREAGLSLKILLPPTAESPALMTAAAGAMEGAFYVYGFNPNLASQKQTEFITNYKNKFSENISWHAAIGYDTINIYSLAIKECASATDIACIQEKIKNTHYSGAQGEITFSENGDANIPVILKTIKSNQFIFYKK